MKTKEEMPLSNKVVELFADNQKLKEQNAELKEALRVALPYVENMYEYPSSEDKKIVNKIRSILGLDHNNR